VRREERILGKKHRKVGVVMGGAGGVLGGQRGEESDWLLLLLLFLNEDGIMIRLVVITRSQGRRGV